MILPMTNDKPILFVIDVQDAIINPDHPLGQAPDFLHGKACDIQALVDDCRNVRGGVDIAWVTHTYTPNASLMPATRSLSEINRRLDYLGDGIYPAMRPQDGDLFFLKDRIGLDRNPHFTSDVERFGLVTRPIGVCGFYTEQCVLGFSFGLEGRGIPHTILQDLTDNDRPISTDIKAQKNIAHLARVFPSIRWEAGRDWLASVSAPRPELRTAPTVPALIS